MTGVVETEASLSLLGAEYAGNVGRTGAVVLISFGSSLAAALVLAGIRDGVCKSSCTYGSKQTYQDAGADIRNSMK